MAISAFASVISSLVSNPSSPHLSPPSYSKFSSLSSLQLPNFLRTADARRVAIASRSRIVPLVTAKKQTFSSLDDLLANSDKPVLVDFYATWCGPCQLMVPILNEVSTVLKDRVQVVKIDTEKYPSIANEYRIEALPTFILFKDGKPYDRFEGAFPADQLIQRIESSLKVKQ